MEQSCKPQACRATAEAEPPPQRAQAVPQGVRVELVRASGQIYPALSLWRGLGLQQLLREAVEPGREDAPWELAARIPAIARFCDQKSEPGAGEHQPAD